MKPAAILFAPEQYWRLTPKQRAAIANGCGTKGWKGKLVPDTIYFLNITPCCNIHDYMYAVGTTQADKDEADEVFLNNMNRWIDTNTSNEILRILRRRRAIKYYLAVKYGGGPAFWDKKNKQSEMGIISLEDVEDNDDDGNSLAAA